MALLLSGGDGGSCYNLSLSKFMEVSTIATKLCNRKRVVKGFQGGSDLNLNCYIVVFFC